MLAIRGGKVLTGNEVLENGDILINDEGKIAAVGVGLEIPADARVIDAQGMWVTPGLIDAHTHIGNFNEPHDRFALQNGNEATNPVTAQIRAIDAFDPHDFAIGETRKAGFTTCCTLPGSANIIGGTGFVWKTREASTVQEMRIPGKEQMKMALGENPLYYGGKDKMPMTRMGNGAVLREALFNAKVYSDQLREGETDPSKKPKPDFKLEALVPVIRGEMSCRIHSHRADDIVTACRIAEEFGIRYSIEHCTEGYKILPYLKERGITAVVGPLNMQPYKVEIWGCRLDTPAKMEQAGIPFCLTQDTASFTKYLPIHIGMAMARGLSFEAALRAVTIEPAKLLDIADRVGTIEPGKDGDLAIFDGNPFCNMTLCRMTVIEGVVYENKD